MLRYLENVTTLELDAERCNGCRMCTRVCPHAVFAMEGKRAVIADQDACMECGACAQNCESEALSLRTGVGCAAGVLIGMFRGTEPTCGCGNGDDGGVGCC